MNLLTEKDAAQLLGMAHATLKKARLYPTPGTLNVPQYLKIGRLVRYRRQDVEQMLGERLIRKHHTQSEQPMMNSLNEELLKINEHIIDNVLSGLDSASKSIALLIERVRILELRVLELEREAIRESHP